MSEMERHKGRLVPVILNGVTMEERAEDACNKFGLCRAKYHESWQEVIEDEGYRLLLIRGDIIFELKDEELDEHYAHATKNPDGSYDYVISFYNGGASLTEVLCAALDEAE